MRNIGALPLPSGSAEEEKDELRGEMTVIFGSDKNMVAANTAAAHVIMAKILLQRLIFFTTFLFVYFCQFVGD